MTFDWLDGLQGGGHDAILVTVAAAEGSVPREAGARMLVTPTQVWDTIGGGHLEFSAIAVARDMLGEALTSFSTSAALPTSLAVHRHLARFALGPTLGQCCGGVVHLAFERITPVAAAALPALYERWQQGLPGWRLTALDSVQEAVIFDAAGRVVAGAVPAVMPALDFDSTSPCRLLRDGAGQRWLLDAGLPHRARLILFGAGHVGAAIVRVLATLPCHVTWVDARPEQFLTVSAAALPANVTIDINEAPESAVDAAPAGASFLVMTHSHALDLQLAQRILERGDAGWFGLIGSRTKRIQFERRLRFHGVADARIAGMTCPIGIDGIDGKAPAVIALAVAAQLQQIWERQEAQQQTQQPRRTGAMITNMSTNMSAKVANQ